MNQDPFIAACRSIYEVCTDEVRTSLTGLGAEGLSWRPGSADANSAAVIAHHALGSTRDWVCISLGLPRPVRSRAEEFATAFASEETALALVDELLNSTLGAFDAVNAVDWLEVVPTVEQPGNPVTTRAYCLVHAIEHLREHTAQLSLTRQLWDAKV